MILAVSFQVPIKSLDLIGLDYYRWLASNSQKLPTDKESLFQLLKERASGHARQIDNALFEISLQTGVEKKIFIKEIGYKSSNLSFINPADYARPQVPVNLLHQEISYRAVLSSLIEPNWPWFLGLAFWDVSVDPTKKGILDSGFSPLGKPATEAVLKEYFDK